MKHFFRWLILAWVFGAAVLLVSCNTAGVLPEGPVTPIVPPPGALTTRSAPATVVPTSAAAQVTAASPVLSASPAPAAGQASIVGTVINGTAGAKTPGSLPLTLYALSPDGSTIMFTRTTTSNASGQFVFDKLDGSTPIMYGIQTQYLKATYTSEPLAFAHGGLTLTMPITVYETTADTGALSVEQMHLFFDFERPGSVTVGQLLIVSNSGDRAYMGTDGTSVHFSLPPNATGVQFADGELGGRYQSATGGFADTQAVAPGTGTTQILVSYDLPYDGKKLNVNLPMIYPVKSVNVLVPEGGVKVTGPQLTESGVRQTQGGNMVNYVGGNLAAGQDVALQLSGAPSLTATGESPGTVQSVPPVLIISAALLLLAAGIVAFVWIKQRRQASQLTEEEAEDVEAQKEELLDAIAALDDDFEAGRIQEADYRRQRAEVKAELVELMKQDE